jgi:inhibitor of KinA sporulation pathway (predicted exonuclease)
VAQKPEELKALLAQLTDERTRLDAAIEDMIADMAQVPPEQRASGAWARDGASTRKYLDLTTRQADIESEIVDLNRAIAEAGSEAPPSTLH